VISVRGDEVREEFDGEVTDEAAKESSELVGLLRQ
jgi:hypothetical protein